MRLHQNMGRGFMLFIRLRWGLADLAWLRRYDRRFVAEGQYSHLRQGHAVNERNDLGDEEWKIDYTSVTGLLQLLQWL